MNFNFVSRIAISLILISGTVSSTACASAPTRTISSDPFVHVQGTRFVRNGMPYTYLGANFWYGMNLGVPGQGAGQTADRERLVRELDRLQNLGINNLRIMALTEGPALAPYRIQPATTNQPGEVDEQLLQGLDFLLVEMGKRGMTAVVCLGNFWHWSGGMAQYVSWFNHSAIPYPPPAADGDWDRYTQYTAQFYSIPSAVDAWLKVVKKVITRTNSISGLAYVNDPTIMSWQLANEPRGMKTPDEFNSWIEKSSNFIRSLDQQHLITTGSEGETPDPNYAGLDPIRNHSFKNIDYATVHLWIQNFGWYDPARHAKTYPVALMKAKQYIQDHVVKLKKLGKPLVLEEFGISRDQGSFDPAANTSVRDSYYRSIFEEVLKSVQSNDPLVGVNFWAWSGEARPGKPYGGMWKLGDSFLGDPPHEPQGWYGVYSSDASTHRVIVEYSQKISGAIINRGTGR